MLLATSLNERFAFSLKVLSCSPIVEMLLLAVGILGRILSKFSKCKFHGRILSTKLINRLWIVEIN